MKHDIPLVVLVALTTTVVSLICRNLTLRESISDLQGQCDNKQATIEHLLDQHDELMRQMRGLGPRLAVE